ncbi:MAG: DUF6531 domain-containing protein [Bdellovibrionales bacterium]
MKHFLAVALSVLFIPFAHAIVDMRSANFSDTWVDIIVPGSGYDLRVRRTYSSRSLFNGMFGFGWCSDFETKIETTAENNLLLTECGGGAEITYTRGGTVNGESIASTIETIVQEVAKRNKKLTRKDLNRLKEDLRKDQYLRMALSRKLDLGGKVESGQTYRANGSGAETIVFEKGRFVRTLEDGTYQFFDKDGQLTRMQDKNRNYLDLKYKGNKLVQVVDNNGRQINLQYKKGTGKVEVISAPGKLMARYEFNGDNLVKVTNQWKTTYQYSYDSLHNLTQILFNDGTSKKITYNEKRDWVTSFTNRKGCVETYDYNVKNDDHYTSKVVKKCDGKVTNQSSYEFIYKRKPGSTDKYLYQAKSDVNGDKSEVTYHPIFGKPVLLVRNDIRTSYEYYDNGFVKTKKERFRHYAYEYKNSCQKVSQVTTKFFGKSSPVTQKVGNKKVVKLQKKLVKSVASRFYYDKNKCNLNMAKNSDGQIVKISYDAKGRISKITDQSKKVVNIKYEERFGKPRYVERPGLGAIQVVYKSNGDIEKVDSKDGPRVAIQVANVFNNLLEIISPATTDLAL